MPAVLPTRPVSVMSFRSGSYLDTDWVSAVPSLARTEEFQAHHQNIHVGREILLALGNLMVPQS